MPLGQTRIPGKLRLPHGSSVSGLTRGRGRWPHSHRDLLTGTEQLLSMSLLPASQEVRWDNDAEIGRRSGLTDPVTTLMRSEVADGATQTLRPRVQGIVERANRHLETSLPPESPSPRITTREPLTSPHDFNVQRSQWLSIANARRIWGVRCVPGRIPGCRPSSDAGTATGPPVPPTVETGTSVRLVHACGRQRLLRRPGCHPATDRGEHHPDPAREIKAGRRLAAMT